MGMPAMSEPQKGSAKAQRAFRKTFLNVDGRG
jgi:hypothetical protein